MYQYKAIFSPTLFVEIRKRMGCDTFQQFEQSIIDAVDVQKENKDGTKENGTDNENTPKDPPDGGTSISDTSIETDDAQEPDVIKTDETAQPLQTEDVTHQGKLILDATVTEQAIRYPTDLGLLNEAREISEQLIDHLYPQSTLKKKPRTYRQKARKQYLAIVKRRRPGAKLYRKGNKQQLQYLQRDIGHIEALLDAIEPKLSQPIQMFCGQAIKETVWRFKHQKQYWVIQTLVEQQQHMHDTKTKRCDDRIVSISQPHVRPIIRGKQNKAVEFGAKLSVSLTGDGIACVDHLRWNAFHEGGDLIDQVERYKKRHGHYPEKVLVDPLYGTRENRRYLKEKGIHYAGKPLGRPKKETEANKEELKAAKKQRHADYVQRIPIEGKFGQGKNGYGLNKIKAKTAKTSFAWINSIFMVMNLMVLLRHFLLSTVFNGVMSYFKIMTDQLDHYSHTQDRIFRRYFFIGILTKF